MTAHEEAVKIIEENHLNYIQVSNMMEINHQSYYRKKNRKKYHKFTEKNLKKLKDGIKKSRTETGKA